MTIREQTGTASRTAPTTHFRLRPRARKAVLLAHIAAGGAWLGIDVALGVLVVAVLVPGDQLGAAVALASIGMFAVWPMTLMGLLTLATGVVLGMGSKYGLIRTWWVAVKLALNVALVAAVLFALRPGVTELAAQARGALMTQTPPPAAADLLFPPVVSTTALLAAMALSVFKPWGSTPWGRARLRRPARPHVQAQRTTSNP